MSTVDVTFKFGDRGSLDKFLLDLEKAQLMSLELSSTIETEESHSRTLEVSVNALAPVVHVAGGLAEILFIDHLKEIRTPDDKHKIVPIVTVTLSHRIEENK